MSVAVAHSVSVAPVEVVRVAAHDMSEWDNYVRARSAGTFFHRFGWGGVVQAAYGYEPLYIAAKREGALAGVLPLIDVNSPLLGRALISTAFTVGGGALADDDAALHALLAAAASLGEDRRARYVECRSDPAGCDGWLEKAGIYAGFKMALVQDENEHLKMIPRKRRAEIRKAATAAAKGELSVRYDGDVDQFYALYARSLRSLGTPVFPKRFVREIMRAFGDSAEIAIVEWDGTPVAALLCFYFGDAVLPYYIGASHKARAVRAFDYLYWSVMRRGAERGCAVFDFGRSRIGGGSYAYKKLWGADPAPLTYRMKLITAAKAPNVNPDNPKFAAFARLWPRLPLAVANRLGPLLAPNFP